MEVIVAAIIGFLVYRLSLPDIGSLSPLLAAASRGDASEVRRLIDTGRSDVKEHDGRFRTALHYAAYSGKHDAARVLIEKGADIEARDYWGETPLHAAVTYGRIEIVRLLIAQGADVNAHGRLAGTPLDCAELALERETANRADADSPDNNRGEQPNGAKFKEIADTIKFLTDKGAKRSSALKDGR
jgi:hypothetical protein